MAHGPRESLNRQMEGDYNPGKSRPGCDERFDVSGVNRPFRRHGGGGKLAEDRLGLPLCSFFIREGSAFPQTGPVEGELVARASSAGDSVDFDGVASVAHFDG